MTADESLQLTEQEKILIRTLRYERALRTILDNWATGEMEQILLEELRRQERKADVFVGELRNP